MLHSRSSKDVFSACRPIATPFRPKAESLRASLGPPPAGLGAINGGGGGGGGQHLKESIALMQNAYSPAASQVRRDKKGNEGMASRSQDPAADEGAGSMAAGLNTRILSPLTLATIDPAAPVSLSISEAAAEENADLHVTFGSTELRLLSGGTNTLSSVDKKGAAGRTEKGRGGKAESAGKKSIFVGSGLGLKHNAKLDAELSKLNKGSTQQILKKILGDRFD